MRKFRVVAAVTAVVLAVYWIVALPINIANAPHFDFFWNAFLGLLLGALLALLPFFTGGSSIRVNYQAAWWIASLVVLLLLLYQYLHAVGILTLPFLRWLHNISLRGILAQSAVLGYSTVFALRARK